MMTSTPYADGVFASLVDSITIPRAEFADLKSVVLDDQVLLSLSGTRAMTVDFRSGECIFHYLEGSTTQKIAGYELAGDPENDALAIIELSLDWLETS